jgi:hypothetical protein
MFEWMILSTPAVRTKAQKRWLKVLRTLNEFQPRLFVAGQAPDLGRGGISRLSQLTGMSRTTITKAVQQLHGGKALGVPPGGGARQPGGGRKKLEQVDPRLEQDLRPDPSGEHGGGAFAGGGAWPDARGIRRPNEGGFAGWGLEQWISSASLEVSTAATGGSTEDTDYGWSLPTRNQPVERDGTPPVLLYQFELERKASGELRDSSEPDRRDKDKTGLTVQAILDTNYYETGMEVTPLEMEQIKLGRHKGFPDWNYTISPRSRSNLFPIVHFIVRQLLSTLWRYRA